MGQIRAEVSEGLLLEYPDHRDFLNPFLNGFYVTWARRRKEYNTEIFAYFLSPEEHFKESYGFDNEILLVYAPYARMEPRTLQAVEQILSMSPAKGRVETLSYFLISDAKNLVDWLDSYVSSRQESRIIVPFFKADLLHAKSTGDSWFVRNTLDKYFFGRDLFNYSLPLVDDAYFFGRQNLIMDYFDSIRRCENRAIFGLRKTGKTSFLFKLKRLCENENIANIIYYDCKVPHVRKAHWNELLADIAKDICRVSSTPHKGEYTERSASRDFLKVIEKLYTRGHKVCLMLDEVEYISFISPKDKHWVEDFVEFWQTMWSCQSRYKCLSFIIAGVNPSVVERDSVKGIQNPLFGIVSHKYLTGLDSNEVKVMLKKLGKRMGLRFDFQACEEISKWYGGHPLLTRHACSNLNSFILDAKPIPVTRELFLQYKEQVDRELVFYSEHAISEIRDFYPNEHRLFELLAVGQDLEFRREADESEIKHLLGYQLIKSSKNGYEVNIPVIATRVALEAKREAGRELIYPIIEDTQRDSWLSRRIVEISSEMRVLEKLIEKSGGIKLFGANSFPEADQLKDVYVCKELDSFSYFINTLNRCFVESVERYGRHQGINDYFWSAVKSNYSYLWSAMHRIKVYRNEKDHLHLDNKNCEYLFNYLDEDFEGKRFSQVRDPFFVLQQRTLDRFLLAILREIDKLG